MLVRITYFVQSPSGLNGRSIAFGEIDGRCLGLRVKEPFQNEPSVACVAEVIQSLIKRMLPSANGNGPTLIQAQDEISVSKLQFAYPEATGEHLSFRPPGRKTTKGTG
jgi:hypothetical protein